MKVILFILMIIGFVHSQSDNWNVIETGLCIEP
jgi:hypothetical protein